MRWALWEKAGQSGPELYLKTPGLPPRRVVTVSQASRRISRKRRQVYRYIRDGTLTPPGKYLGEWVLDRDEVESLAALPPTRQRLPGFLQPLFPEHALGDLNAGRDRSLVLSRVLEHGGTRELRWALRRYDRAALAGFVAADGARLLSPRALNFWSLWLGVERPSRPAWRERGWDRGASV